MNAVPFIMTLHRIVCWCALLAGGTAAVAQPSFTAPHPSTAPVEDASARRAAYLARVNEALNWRMSLAKPGDPATVGLAEIAAKLARREDAALCSERLIELMKKPAGDMFWMFPVTCISYLGRDQLTPAAKAAVREAWRTYFPLRGDTENHWVMYYTSVYLMAQLWPDEPGERWFNGKSSDELFNEARGFLLHWMELTTTIGQGEYDCTHYIGEYAIPMLYLATWAKDPAMRQRGRMMLDYVLADFAVETLNGIYIGSHARTDDTTVLEKWNALSSFFGWLFLGNCPPPASYGGWGIYFAAVAENYELPEVIYRIGTDRVGAYTHFERKRTRHRWRNSDVRNAPVYKTTFVGPDYAVGSDQGGLLQPIQQHSWDVTWAVPDPRGVHNTIFSTHPLASSRVLQMYFTEYPDWMIDLLASQGKPSYGVPDKILSCSPYEQVFQDLDTVIALYDIPPGVRHQHINGFFSRDLAHLTEDASGWIFARGGNTYLAYRPLAGYEWQPLLGYRQLPSTGSGYRWERFRPEGKVDQILYSPHPKNGTIVQAASADEFESFAAFQAAINALPLEFTLEPTPSVRLTTLRGQQLVFTYGQAPVLNGTPVAYSQWQLYEGPHLNAALGSRRITISHGRLHRVLNFNNVTITDHVAP